MFRSEKKCRVKQMFRDVKYIYRLGLKFRVSKTFVISERYASKQKIGDVRSEGSEVPLDDRIPKT